ncbi:MAG: ATP-binding cassette domain-containing protein [Oscillospiraceae bacterium]|nr:ATP-binding cassette domain-containing protein [Oscillospiraceae bacterium]
MIKLTNIRKTFKVSRRNAGIKNALMAMIKRDHQIIEALADISFNVDDGEMVGYIGPNGAGKSSTIKIMSGILNPDSGECIINGRVPWKDRVNHVKEIGVVFGQRSQLWWDVPVIDSFELLRDIYSVDETTYKNNLSTLTEILGISVILRTPARQLSLGQRMRCEIAASLLHNPRILFLDEPTIGLDAVSKIAVREFIKHINRERQTTVILTTHDMQDIDALTNRILLIGKGRILLDGSLDELKKRYSLKRKITIDGNITQHVAHEGITETERGIYIIDTDKMSISEAVSILTKDIEIRDISVENTSLEEVIVNMYKDYSI